MKKLLAFIVLVCALIGLTGCAKKSVQIGYDYDREKAVAYARAFSYERNRDFPELSSNCTNFVSQCLIAGGMAVDPAPTPTGNKRINYIQATAEWYYSSIFVSDEKPPNYTVSTSFVRTTDFVDYWVNTRNMSLSTYSNTFSGRAALIKDAMPGDVILMYSVNGKIAHLGILTEIMDADALFCANTTDHLDFSICEISNSKYPQFGLIRF